MVGYRMLLVVWWLVLVLASVTVGAQHDLGPKTGSLRRQRRLDSFEQQTRNLDLSVGEVSFPAIATAQVVEGSSVVYELDIIHGDGTTVTFIVHSENEAIKVFSSKGLTNLQFEKTPESVESNSIKDTLGQVFSATTIENFPCYRNLETSFDFINDLVNNYPDLATVLDIGDSYFKTNEDEEEEGYDILVLQLTAGPSSKKAQFFAMFGLHAREMAPPELGMRFAEMLVGGYGVDADITSLLENTEIHFVLQANPDGRKIAETKQDLFRRKNMRPTRSDGGKEPCDEGTFGVDLNRNFPFMWGREGASEDPCSQTYRGVRPASEPEVQAIVQYVSNLLPTSQRKADPQGDNLEDPYPITTTGMFLDVHSFSEITIWPWGFRNSVSSNNEELKALAIKFGHFNDYGLAGPEEEDFLYIVSGDSVDWAYGALGASAYVFELGTEFYQDCDYFESNIAPNNLPALLYAARVARFPYSQPLGPDVTNVVLSSTAIPNDEASPFFLSVSVEASDAAYSDPTWSTSQQGVSQVFLYVDEYPYDDGATGIPLEVSDTSDTTTATVHLAGNDVLSSLSSSVGTRMLHFQAVDSAGFEGPVASVFIDVCDASDAGCLAGRYNPPQCSDPSTLYNTLVIPSLGATTTVSCFDLYFDSDKSSCSLSRASEVCACACA